MLVVARSMQHKMTEEIIHFRGQNFTFICAPTLGIRQKIVVVVGIVEEVMASC
jgi:hypothetical protein